MIVSAPPPPLIDASEADEPMVMLSLPAPVVMVCGPPLAVAFTVTARAVL